MKHLFVPYALALILKEKGFDEECFGFFKYKEFNGIWQDDMNPAANSDISPWVAAPLYQQVIDWLRSQMCYIDSVSRLDRETGKTNIRYHILIKYIGPHPNFPKSKYSFREWDTNTLDDAIEEALKLIP